MILVIYFYNTIWQCSLVKYTNQLHLILNRKKKMNVVLIASRRLIIISHCKPGFLSNTITYSSSSLRCISGNDNPTNNITVAMIKIKSFINVNFCPTAFIIFRY